MKVIKQKEWEILLSKENAIRINIKAKENDVRRSSTIFAIFCNIIRMKANCQKWDATR